MFESSAVLRALIPGQVSFDNGVTALENGKPLQATAHFGAMVGEQVLSVLSLGSGQTAGSAVRLTAAEAAEITARAEAKSQGRRARAVPLVLSRPVMVEFTLAVAQTLVDRRTQ